MYDINQNHSSIIKLPFLYTIVMYKSILMFNWGHNWGLVLHFLELHLFNCLLIQISNQSIIWHQLNLSIRTGRKLIKCL